MRWWNRTSKFIQLPSKLSNATTVICDKTFYSIAKSQGWTKVNKGFRSDWDKAICSLNSVQPTMIFSCLFCFLQFDPVHYWGMKYFFRKANRFVSTESWIFVSLNFPFLYSIINQCRHGDLISSKVIKCLDRTSFNFQHISIMGFAPCMQKVN